MRVKLRIKCAQHTHHLGGACFGLLGKQLAHAKMHYMRLAKKASANTSKTQLRATL
jgi:hypothetical protein